MTNETQSPSTVDTNEQRPRVNKLTGFIANHATSVILTLIIGSGTTTTATLTYLHNKVDMVIEQAEDTKKEVDEIRQTLHDYVNQEKIDREVLPRLGHLEQGLSEVKDIVREVDDVVLDIESLEDQVKEGAGNAKDHREALRESIKDRLTSVKQSVNEKIELRTERLEENQEFYRDDIIDEIQALPERLSSVHHTFIGMLDRLIREGTLAIRDGSTEILYEWMLKANYVVRSLPIPSEDGILLNRSLVEQALRKAISEYEKAGDTPEEMKEKISHAERTLQIVKAVRDLAEAGKIQ